jgi:hypothetical protein
MSATTMCEVKAAAVALVRAADLDAKVLFGGKVETTFTPGSLVSFGDIRFTRTVTTMWDAEPGQPAVDESFDIDCVVEVTVTGTDQAKATRRACELFDEVDALFRVRDETLGVDHVQSVRLVAEGRVIEAKDARTLQSGRSTAIPFILRVIGVI